jgi:AcrR family transcriptional regulator
VSGQTAGPGATGAGGPAGRPRGRPARDAAAAGAPGTREQILAAARAAFAEHGYDKASVRAIARGAGVDSALVHHYYGTKEQVFAAAVAAAVAPALTALHAVPEDDPEVIGAHLVRYFLGIWENPETRGPLRAIVRSALTNDTAARIFRGFIAEEMMRKIATRLDGEDAPLRIQLATAQLVGTAILRYIICVEPLASTPVEEIAARLTPVVQSHLTGTPPGPAPLPR